ncbi:MAG TPA: hypothetical protein VG426_12865 [Candidatus Dormibacteraeota bacterium]|nr:hypothetical protein [Candidatus Dormibacteraeota bacterium]
MIPPTIGRPVAASPTPLPVAVAPNTAPVPPTVPEPLPLTPPDPLPEAPPPVSPLLDFDYFAMAETSYDLGKYCGYIVPSAPGGWEDSLAAEETRANFLRRYLELRPHATIERFPIYEALTLALRAMTFMWAQRSGWQKTAETFLVMAHERLYSRLHETI